MRGIIVFTLLSSLSTFGHVAHADAETVISSVFGRTPNLTASDFAELSKASIEDPLDNELKCTLGSAVTSALIPDIFSDRKFERRFSKDPVFQFLKTYLYFNDSEENVAPSDLAGLKRYAKAFFLLYRNGLVLNPELKSLTLGNSYELTKFWQEDRDPAFGKPRSVEELQALTVVKTLNSKTSNIDFGPQRFSAATIEIFSRFAQYPELCGMNSEERAALGIYIGMGFSKLNPYLRSGSQNDAKLNLLETLVNRALDKIENSRRLVFRTTTFLTQPDMPESVYRAHRMGAVVNYLAFTSTATSPKRNSNFLIYSKTGKNLGPLTVESEVLFKSRTSFRVRYNSCEEQNAEHWQGCNVILEEIDPSSAVLKQ